MERLLGTIKRILYRPVQQRQICRRAAIILKTLEGGRAQIHHAENVTQACRKTFTPFECTAQLQHGDIGQQCECCGEACQLPIVIHCFVRYVLRYVFDQPRAESIDQTVERIPEGEDDMPGQRLVKCP